MVITHTPTGTRGEASERRSQAENRQRALLRLRVNLALQVRQACQLVGYVPSAVWSSRCRNGRLAVRAEHPDFAAMLAEALDVMAACASDAKRAAVHLGCSPSQLIKLLQREPRAIALVNQQRQAAGIPVYR